MDGEKPAVVHIGSKEKRAQWMTSGGVAVPMPPPMMKTDARWKSLYILLCEGLIEDGRQIRAAAIHITLLVESILTWIEDRRLCEEEGRYAISKEGNRYELPHSYNERKANEQLKRELPEACMTVMSQIEARLKESKIGDQKQDDLFDDLLEHARSRPRAVSG
jgi:hypothetical protein